MQVRAEERRGRETETTAAATHIFVYFLHRIYPYKDVGSG